MRFGQPRARARKVWWTGTSNALPEDIVKRFDGKVMAVVGMESDQVRKGAGPNGEDVPVPITMSYNHALALLTLVVVLPPLHLLLREDCCPCPSQHQPGSLGTR